jgi:galactose-1-phosphate uridylyltransferase
MNINRTITELIDYAVECGLVDVCDRAYITGRVMHLLALDEPQSQL